ncbi:hypothetical protein K8B83_18910 [Shewanella inventionis]|uniref:hypothetical protein n=1 Tax=Shewanella inventionis TaxID=1738770 RepID=UPI001CC126BC|nr:hypothetical protein [Shewanella inventionis]UAL42863.1 hypothetical protein K8B83_18910 [Shewanella inventionis]
MNTIQHEQETTLRYYLRDYNELNKINTNLTVLTSTDVTEQQNQLNVLMDKIKILVVDLNTTRESLGLEELVIYIPQMVLTRIK